MMLKRIISLLLSLLLLVSVVPAIPASAVKGMVTEDGLFVYEGDDNYRPGMRILAYQGPPVSVLEIPDYIGEFPVLSIGEGAFAGNTDIKTVILPNNFRHIGMNAFKGCTSLAQITIPKGTQIIDEYAFEGCTSLIEVTYIGKPSIRNYAFAGCTALGELPIHSGTTMIWPYTFFGCTGLKEITIPDNVVNISNNAFAYCTGLEKVKLPEKTNEFEVGNSVFRGCSSLKEITIPECFRGVSFNTFEGCESLETVIFHGGAQHNPALPYQFWVRMSAFSGCTSLKNVIWYGTEERMRAIEIEEGNDYLLNAEWQVKPPRIPDGTSYILDKNENKVTIESYTGTIPDVVIPPTIEGYPVTTISSGAFSVITDTATKNTTTKTLTLPDSITELGKGAFHNCIALESVNIPRSITTISQNLFLNCTSLKTITIPDWVDTISDNAFEGCIALESITIPNSVKTIESNAFQNCKSLTGIDLPSGLTKIPMFLFWGCEKLESLIIPEGVTQIEDNAFYNCKSLKSITLPKSLKTIYSNAFANCNAISTINYTGTEEDWQKVYITNNTQLNNAEFIYHVHDWQFDSITRKATCSHVGESIYTCYCGGQKVTEIAKLPHIEVIDKAIPATCTEYGSTEGSHCSVCGEVIIQRIAVSPTPHVYDNDCDSVCNNRCGNIRSVPGHVYDNDCDSSCNICQFSRDAEHIYDNTCDPTCNRCSYTRDTDHRYDNVCDAICNYCYYERTVLGHNFEWVIDKTENCGDDGQKHEECIHCQEKRNEGTAIKATGEHSYDNDCDERCNVCFESRSASHNYDWVIDTPATCSTTGSKHEECTVCQKKKNLKKTTIPATGKHTYTNSCDASCNDCGKLRMAYHVYQETNVAATLENDGYTIKVCSVCGKQYDGETVINKVKTIKLSATSYTYNGGSLTPSVTVKDSADKTLIRNTDYTVTYASGRKNVGTYNVTIKLIGKYSGTKTLTFKINPAKISSYKLSATSYTYDGKVKTPSVSVKDSAEKTLKKDTDYTITYASGLKNVGSYKVTIKGKGNYTGTKTFAFKINPAKSKVSKLTAAKKSLKVKLTKVSSQATGYEIQYSTSKKFTSAKTKKVTSYKTTSVTLKSLKAKKTYYVRVRTYKKVGSTIYYSGWSDYKSKKTK